jgi:hypothetical protein
MELYEEKIIGGIKIMLMCFKTLIVLGKMCLLVAKYLFSGLTLTFREIVVDAIIMIICISFTYSLYFLTLVYCIISDTQRNAQMKFTSDQRWVSHCYTLSVIVYIPAFKLLFNIPQGLS